MSFIPLNIITIFERNLWWYIAIITGIIALSKSFIHDNIFKANLLKTTIENFFDNRNPNIKKYQKILINGSLDQEPSNIISKSADDAQIVCIIDNKEFKHKIVNYVKVNGNCNRFIVDEASSSFIYKFVKKEPFVF